MQRRGKIVVVSQHYPPDSSTTAAIVSDIAHHLALEAAVLVLSGTPQSASSDPVDQPLVVEIRNRMPEKTKLIKRAAAELFLTVRTFVAVLKRLQRDDVVLTVPAPFMLPYAVVAAAKLKRAQSILIMHDLYPEVLVVAGLLKPDSLLTKAIRGANALMFRALTAIVVIGRDTEQLLLRYQGAIRDKISFIPNWATLRPGVRPVADDNPYRVQCKARFVVGLSGNLGFTHDPVIVFDAARMLRDDPTIHFLLSGWGVGFEQLRRMQLEAKLPNVTLIERVAEDELEQLLSAADVWIIPYRRNVVGVSTPSRFYNLLAVGRPVILVSEPQSEAALIVRESNLGWVVMPGAADQLAKAVGLAARSADPSMAERAVAIAGNFSLDRAMTSYAVLVHGLLRNRGQPENHS